MELKKYIFVFQSIGLLIKAFVFITTLRFKPNPQIISQKKTFQKTNIDTL